MKLSVVLFDLDGTLVDSLPHIIKTYRLVFERLGLPWAGGEVINWIGRPLKDIAGYFAKSRADEFLELYWRYYNQEHDRHLSLFPGTLEMLKELREKRIRLGIVTSKGSDGTRRAIELTGLDKFMEIIITAGDTDRHKPFPDPLLKALALLNACPGETVYIGDSRYDLEAGRRAGVAVFGVTWGMATREELAALSPDEVLETWSDLTQIIRNANN